jgi:hypothetical protein
MRISDQNSILLCIVLSFLSMIFLSNGQWRWCFSFNHILKEDMSTCSAAICWNYWMLSILEQCRAEESAQCDNKHFPFLLIGLYSTRILLSLGFVAACHNHKNSQEPAWIIILSTTNSDIFLIFTWWFSWLFSESTSRLINMVSLDCV